MVGAGWWGLLMLLQLSYALALLLDVRCGFFGVWFVMFVFFGVGCLIGVVVGLSCLGLVFVGLLWLVWFGCLG